MRVLAVVLREELSIIQELVITLRQEQEALKTDDLTAMQKINVTKGELARRLAALEQEREEVLQKTILGEENTGSIYESNEEEIDNLRNSLKKAVIELQDVYETNRLLMRQSIAYVQKMMSLLAPEGVTTGKVEWKV